MITPKLCANNDSPSRRRLSKILDADPRALIATNERAAAGLKPQKISRFDN